ncbi:MarR family transcriptional regulator [Frankia sp. CNm7]|uniref:MarR family transcriptional regulator n=1 Tax=Frankia nepalensis TaxID=1836974 RepID=A0A937RNK0_9ACTN|nr:MarR family transcriptional regulator [Frankia nepalensis]MBL7502552.1 MarR family transcriptional regulator [Frankia nepalensis]MBL7511740.1 MarR family transcriptional regulator [Frankia nepalensis]MBL7524738.1 MarR family transcriptional regulator [Frankia nepalensis]MBL7629126.1 MarR family transcriptional regulator [Frankia nepalensis]
MSTDAGPGAGARLGAELSDAVVLFHDAIGSLMGLSATDHKALGILRREGPMSATRLAARTGLTPGAVTGLVDRLEAAGLARRERDGDDRRRLTIVATDPASPDVAAAFARLQRAMAGVTAQFSAGELAVVARWVEATTTVLREQVHEIAHRRAPEARTGA